MTRVELELFADYFQFYLQDELSEGNLGDSWDREAVLRLLAVAPGTIGVGTARNMTVPVIVEVVESMPLDTLEGNDLVTEATMDVPSGRIVVAGCTDYFPDARRIPVAPGRYRARIYYSHLDELSDDGLEGQDSYRVVLWLENDVIDPRILHDRRGATSDSR